jgi:hypothetical protein
MCTRNRGAIHHQFMANPSNMASAIQTAANPMENANSDNATSNHAGRQLTA